MAAKAAVSQLKVSEVEKRVSGDPATDSWRLFYVTKEGVPVSALHDIPLYASGEGTASPVFNFVCEIPRYRNAKLEICLKEKFNPIKQDIKKGNLRFVHNVLPFQGYLFNYGAFPQTWESPSFKHPETNCFGDNDPLDVCEIGQATADVGDIIQVKVLGVMALIDDGETDWKVITINVNDPEAAEFNDVEDIEKKRPGYLHAVYEWFRTYKMPAGDPANEFAFDGATRNRDYALEVIKENYDLYLSLIAGDKNPKDETQTLAEAHGIELANVHLNDKNTLSVEDAKAALQLAEAQGIPPTNELNFPEDGSVLNTVKNSLRKNPQWTGELADVIADVAHAAAGGDITKSAHLAAVGDQELNAEKAYAVVVDGNNYTIFLAKNSYTSSGSPKSIEVGGKQYCQIGTAKVEGDVFSYDTGYGVQTFKKEGATWKSS
mmetsp:Transcript_13735/g.35049  ORF Transcript_13735/g.35049 Transcript_13735/m.35049 type:complete len:433 (+) Transcript_13735:82-1380(+)|eukprot:CAMPEP_0177655174 /NCGR_PEP_ID=MMETSP0447-20121125/14800_1 /TAXON_ID=0 /ORGANISM="Stygamoeba regulata, Strain BSH-02190019" /LENGTH=432 /DNA_ID=CAMNT_0019159023 /DNA_START=81 /DNA_END=1379 /DNA_ORIENTATION=-